MCCDYAPDFFIMDLILLSSVPKKLGIWVLVEMEKYPGEIITINHLAAEIFETKNISANLYV